MNSQNNEEAKILEYFGENPGRLLDIGAADGKVFSNTYALLQKGWQGVMVEPSSHLIPALLKNTEAFNVEVVNAIIGTQTAGWVRWYECPDFVSTMNEAHAKIWKETPYQKVTAFQHHWQMLLSKFGDTFDFINIDVEGGSAELFKAMFSSFPNCRAWCIEHDYKQQEIAGLAEGYTVMVSNGENIILVK